MQRGLIGMFCRPFSNAAAETLVSSLSQTLTTVTISGINIVNVTQVGCLIDAYSKFLRNPHGMLCPGRKGSKASASYKEAVYPFIQFQQHFCMAQISH